MPWLPENFIETISEAKERISNNFEVIPSASVFLCSFDEFSNAVLEELKDRNFSKEQIETIKRIYLNQIIGKYFYKTNEVWLLEGKGDNLETLVHELLHSIQKCEPNREKIVDYLTYKLTGLSTQITESTFVPPATP